MWYGDDVVPDIIVVGKAWKSGALFAIDRPAGIDAWLDLSGEVTCQLDETVGRRMLHFLWVVHGADVAENCVQMGRWIRANVTSSHRFAFLHGIGTMWHTNIAMDDPEVTQPHHPIPSTGSAYDTYFTGNASHTETVDHRRNELDLRVSCATHTNFFCPPFPLSHWHYRPSHFFVTVFRYNLFKQQA